MVSTQANRAPLSDSDGELVDHALRIGTAINIVAEIDFERVFDWPPLEIVLNANDGFSKQIGPAVNVADGVDTRIGRQ